MPFIFSLGNLWPSYYMYLLKKYIVYEEDDIFLFVHKSNILCVFHIEVHRTQSCIQIITCFEHQFML